MFLGPAVPPQPTPSDKTVTTQNAPWRDLRPPITRRTATALVAVSTMVAITPNAMFMIESCCIFDVLNSLSLLSVFDLRMDFVVSPRHRSRSLGKAKSVCTAKVFFMPRGCSCLATGSLINNNHSAPTRHTPNAVQGRNERASLGRLRK
jgi:hypothetical protein